jgi:4-amino-4-deoxy-L-arabinose transferase-like glycosyltransferase
MADNKRSLKPDVMRIVERFAPPRHLLAAMTALQVLWLSVIWITGAAYHWQKLGPLIIYTIIAGVTVYLIPAAFASRLGRIQGYLAQDKRRLIFGLCVAFLTAAIVYASYQEPLNDEVSLFRASRIVAVRGVAAFFADYTDIYWLGGQHPPLAPLVYGFAMRVLGVDILSLRSIAITLTLGAVLLTYRLGEDLYDTRTGLLAALLLIAVPYTLRMGTALLTDMPIEFFFVLSLLLIRRLLRAPSFPLAVAIGILVGAGLLCKYTMAFIYPVLLCYFATDNGFRRVKPHLGVLLLTSLGLLIIWLAYAYRTDIITSHAETISGYAGVVTSGMGGLKYMIEMISTELTSALGLYNIPFLFLGGLHLLQQRSKSDLFLLLWIIPVFAIVALTLPDPRYFMPAFPALALAMARGMERFFKVPQKVILLALLLCGGSLYLYADWNRATYMFMR